MEYPLLEQGGVARSAGVVTGSPSFRPSSRRLVPQRRVQPRHIGGGIGHDAHRRTLRERRQRPFPRHQPANRIRPGPPVAGRRDPPAIDAGRHPFGDAAQIGPQHRHPRRLRLQHHQRAGFQPLRRHRQHIEPRQHFDGIRSRETGGSTRRRRSGP